MDPRIGRTKQHVLKCAQELLVESGADGVTFTAVSQRARVSRNTLYRHWTTREQLLVDVALQNYLGEDSARAPSASLEDFLKAVRANLQSPGTAAALINLMARAEYDPTSKHVLRQVAETRQRDLAASAGELTDLEFARIVGPVFFQALVARRPVDDAFIADLAAAATRDSSLSDLQQSQSLK